MEKQTSNKIITRRQFIRRSTLAVGASTLAFPYVGQVLGANDRINVACIGVGGKGDGDSTDAAKSGGTVVAICDVDQNTLSKKGAQFPDAKRYNDFRRLYDEMG